MDDFDQAQYWIDRHRDLAGDPRSVGNLGAAREDNRVGEQMLQSLVRSFVEPLSPGSVLDLGCGYGRIAGPFLENGWSYTGIDVSPDALKQAREQHPDGKFSQHDLLAWQPERRYDMVLALYVLVHFVDDKSWAEFASKAFDAVATDGLMVMADHYPEERKVARHFVARPLEEYSELLQSRSLVPDAELTSAIHADTSYGPAKQFRVFRKAG